MTTLDVVRAEIAAAEARSERGAQVMTGASQIYGCRAESLLRYLGTPESDPRTSWPAVVGKAVHEALAIAATAGVIVEQRFTYRGVPATVDRLDGTVLTDYKTKDDDAAVAEIKRTGPERGNVAQVHLGAAAAIEAGHDVRTVELLFLPRAGSLEDGWLWSAPFDRTIADDAVEWVYREYGRAMEIGTLDAEGYDPLDGLRDEYPSFCRSYCPFVTTCRGKEDLPLIDDRIADIATQYDRWKTQRDEAVGAMKMLRPDLEGIAGRTPDGLKIRWQGGNDKEAEELDLDKVLTDYRAIIGQPPMKTVTKVTARSLRIERDS